MTLAMDEKQKTGALLLRTFRPGDEKPFKELNELWIVRHFALEDVDREVLDDPKGHILDAGGEICIAEIDGQVVGCCALLVTGSNEYELAKMTVSEAARGRGVGRNLLRYSIDHARTMGRGACTWGRIRNWRMPFISTNRWASRALLQPSTNPSTHGPISPWRCFSETH